MIYRKRLGGNFSEAARLLWEEMERRHWRQSDMAKVVGVDPVSMHRYMYGDRRPRSDVALRIQRRFRSVKVELWFVSPSEEFEPPAEAA